jgi:hypothetical protein
MDELAVNAFANRDDPIPLITFGRTSDLSDSQAAEVSAGGSKRHSLKKNSSKSNSGGSPNASNTGQTMQDRLLERCVYEYPVQCGPNVHRLLKQVMPVEDFEDTVYPSSFLERPNFNIATMSNNFRRFNSRIGVIFVFQARVIKLLGWRTWSHTVSFLAVYTFVCLDPYLLSVLPLAVLLLAVLIPSFIARHPAPPTAAPSSSFEYSLRGPPIAPARTVKPVKELSKDFFRNMRDLQNCMEDFSRVHDMVISLLNPPTNFSNEALSSTVFLSLCIATAVMFLASHLMPWRFIFLIGGWSITCASHPKIQKIVIATHKEHVVPHEKQAKTLLDAWASHDIILDSEPETREVEVFELQKLSSAGEWESWLFSPSSYDPLSPARIAEERPKGTRFFEDVQAPPGWEWSEKKWTLDLWSREWVEERIITCVEVETEGERWVYDIEYQKPEHPESVRSLNKARGGMEQMPSWEDGGWSHGKRGEWRRRRWMRMVKRKNITKQVDAK